MMIAMSQKDIELRQRRVRELYTSGWTVDNLTAIMMDTSVGSIGYNEVEARAKADKIIGWLENIVKLDVPENHKDG